MSSVCHFQFHHSDRAVGKPRGNVYGGRAVLDDLRRIRAGRAYRQSALLTCVYEIATDVMLRILGNNIHFTCYL